MNAVLEDSERLRIVAIIQARMGSRRLPGKTLSDVHGVPMLVRMLHQVEGALLIDDVIVATSDDPSDDPVSTTVEALGKSVVRYAGRRNQ